MAKQECANAGQDSRSTVESNKSLVPSVSHPRGSVTLCTPHTEQKSSFMGISHQLQQ